MMESYLSGAVHIGLQWCHIIHIDPEAPYNKAIIIWYGSYVRKNFPTADAYAIAIAIGR